jgi:hypothetical protein
VSAGVTGSSADDVRLYMSAAVGESETAFWRRKALERALRITELERVVANLRDALAEYEEA